MVKLKMQRNLPWTSTWINMQSHAPKIQKSMFLVFPIKIWKRRSQVIERATRRQVLNMLGMKGQNMLQNYARFLVTIENLSVHLLHRQICTQTLFSPPGILSKRDPRNSTRTIFARKQMNNCRIMCSILCTTRTIVGTKIIQLIYFCDGYTGKQGSMDTSFSILVLTYCSIIRIWFFLGSPFHYSSVRRNEPGKT